MKCLVHIVLGALLVTASAYTPMECGNNGITADGTMAKAGCTVAVSRDLRHLMGKTIHIEGVGKRKVNDIMAKRWKQAIDVVVPSARAAREFGRRKVAVEVIR